jgi:hypothetical protein
VIYSYNFDQGHNFHSIITSETIETLSYIGNYNNVSTFLKISYEDAYLTSLVQMVISFTKNRTSFTEITKVPFSFSVDPFIHPILTQNGNQTILFANSYAEMIISEFYPVSYKISFENNHIQFWSYNNTDQLFLYLKGEYPSQLISSTLFYSNKTVYQSVILYKDAEYRIFTTYQRTKLVCAFTYENLVISTTPPSTTTTSTDPPSTTTTSTDPPSTTTTSTAPPSIPRSTNSLQVSDTSDQYEETRAESNDTGPTPQGATNFNILYIMIGFTFILFIKVRIKHK